MAFLGQRIHTFFIWTAIVKSPFSVALPLVMYENVCFSTPLAAIFVLLKVTLCDLCQTDKRKISVAAHGFLTTWSFSLLSFVLLHFVHSLCWNFSWIADPFKFCKSLLSVNEVNTLSVICCWYFSLFSFYRLYSWPW